MQNKYINFKLKEDEIEIIQLALVHYITKKEYIRTSKNYVEKAKILLDNINFYNRQQNEE